MRTTLLSRLPGPRRLPGAVRLSGLRHAPLTRSAQLDAPPRLSDDMADVPSVSRSVERVDVPGRLAARGVTIISHNVRDVWHVLRDFEGQVAWASNITDSQRLPDLSDGRVHLLQVGGG